MKNGIIVALILIVAGLFLIVIGYGETTVRENVNQLQQDNETNYSPEWPDISSPPQEDDSPPQDNGDTTFPSSGKEELERPISVFELPFLGIVSEFEILGFILVIVGFIILATGGKL